MMVVGILFSILMVISACSQAEEVVPEETETLSEIAAASETGAEVEPAQRGEEPTERAEVSFQPGDCILTPEIVERYCAISSEESLSVDNEFPCAVKQREGSTIIQFEALSVPEIYRDYGVSSLTDFARAEREEIAASDSDPDFLGLCPAPNFPAPRPHLADETIVSNTFWSDYGISDYGTGCPQLNSISDLDSNGFILYTKRNTMMGRFESSGEAEGTVIREGCSVSEVELMVRNLLLGEEVPFPEREEPSAPPVVEEVMERVEQKCFILMGIDDKIEALAEEKFKTEFSARGLDDNYEFEASPNTERVRKLSVEWRDKWRKDKPASYRSDGCLISTSWDEYRRNQPIIMGASEIDGPPLEGVTNYFYVSKLTFVYLYFQDPKNQGVYMVEFDGRNIQNENPRDNLNERLNIVAEFTDEIVLPLMKKCKNLFYKEYYQRTVCSD